MNMGDSIVVFPEEIHGIIVAGSEVANIEVDRENLATVTGAPGADPAEIAPGEYRPDRKTIHARVFRAVPCNIGNYRYGVKYRPSGPPT